MSIKDNIKEELLKMIDEERKNIDNRLKINGDVFELMCEDKFLDKLKTFVNSL